MKNLLSTNPDNWTALIIRLAVGIVIFPHGAQKLFGWFNGYGFQGTMGFLTGNAHLPWIVAFLVILIESIGSLFLIFGFLTRIAAFGMFVNFLGILVTSHINNGFFMNWYSTPNKPEGFEYHLLGLGITLALLIACGGKWSIDAVLSYSNKRSVRMNTAIAY